jgi:hypothetical protein
MPFVPNRYESRHGQNQTDGCNGDRATQNLESERGWKPEKAVPDECPREYENRQDGDPVAPDGLSGEVLEIAQRVSLPKSQIITLSAVLPFSKM